MHPSVIGYGLAKQVLATGSAAYAHQYGLTFLHCVLATLYGPHDNKASDRSHFVGALLDRAVREKAAGAEQFEVWGNLQTVREVLYVDDQIDAVLAADRAFDNEILNCAANTPVTVEAVARAPWYAWLGGLLGALYIVGAVFIAPRIGAAALVALIVVGQMLTALAFDHFGILGIPVHAVSWARLAGAALLIAGAALVCLS